MKKGKRYDVSELIEAQFEPGSRKSVLKNLLRIKNKLKMDEFEAEALREATEYLVRKIKRSHKFTAKEICDLHRLWLGKIYPWAGQYRQVNLSKGDFAFATAGHIPSLMEEFEKGPLKQNTPTNFKEKGRIIQALAEVHVELVLIHPFREGNGRLARLLTTLMAVQAGIGELDFSPLTGKNKRRYFSAVRSGLDKNYKPMESLFEAVIRKTES